MSGSRKVVAIVVPHPDDLEILVGHTVLYFLRHGYRVVEILCSWGEYGVVNRFKNHGDRLKGFYLRKIRQKENSQAKTAYGFFPDGSPCVQTIPLSYIDGHVPTSKKAIARLQNIFNNLNPAIIIGPDPVFSIDWHVDHMACAYNVYFAVRQLLNSRATYLERYLLFQSFRPNYYLPIYRENWGILEKAHLAHRSQLTPFTVKLLLALHRRLLWVSRRGKTRLRNINLKELPFFAPIGQNSSLLDYIIYGLLGKRLPANETYLPEPDKLGLVVDPPI